MGPALAPNSATDGFIWAHYWSHMCCQWSCMGPALATKYTADHLVWAQSWPQPIVMHGPSTGPNICCLKLCMDPALVPKYVTDCLAWAQHCPQNMVLMALYGPSICFKIYSRSSCMGPELSS